MSRIRGSRATPTQVRASRRNATKAHVSRIGMPGAKAMRGSGGMRIRRTIRRRPKR
jgi:hypothetical protein